MRKFILYSTVLFCLLAGTNSCRQKNPLPSLKETFAKKDKIPFGTYVAYELLNQYFTSNTFLVKKQDFETTWKYLSDTGSLYINISKHLILTKADRQSMLDYVSKGNTLFIASEFIDSLLLDSMRCKLANKFYTNFNEAKPFQHTSVHVSFDYYDDTSRYGYFYYPMLNHFSTIDSSVTTILGKNELEQANFILFFYGKGRFYFHCEPKTLSNYFLLKNKNYKYLQQVFSFMKNQPEHVFWDDYYNKKNSSSSNNAKSGLSVLFQYPAMKWAFLLLIGSFLLYILFGSKRRQRVIPVIPPNKNTTLGFTETIGRLYLQNKNNRNIADKIITYFYEHIRNQFYMNTNTINDEFILQLSRKSGFGNDATKKLFKTIALIQHSTDISDEQLLSLNQQIENFYKTKI